MGAKAFDGPLTCSLPWRSRYNNDGPEKSRAASVRLVGSVKAGEAQRSGSPPDGQSPRERDNGPAPASQGSPPALCALRWDLTLEPPVPFPHSADSQSPAGTWSASLVDLILILSTSHSRIVFPTPSPRRLSRVSLRCSATSELPPHRRLLGKATSSLQGRGGNANPQFAGP